MNSLTLAKFSSLKYLEFYTNYIESPRCLVCPDDLAALIENCHNNLEQVMLPRTGSSHKLVKALRLCDAEEFLEFLKNNDRLEKATLICYGDSNIEYFFTKTSRQWPDTLSTLNLRGQWIISNANLQ